MKNICAKLKILIYKKLERHNLLCPYMVCYFTGVKSTKVSQDYPYRLSRDRFGQLLD